MQGCANAPLLFNMISTAVPLAAEKRFIAEAAIMHHMVQLQRKEKCEKKDTSRTYIIDERRGKEGAKVQRLRGML